MAGERIAGGALAVRFGLTEKRLRNWRWAGIGPRHLRTRCTAACSKDDQGVAAVARLRVHGLDLDAIAAGWRTRLAPAGHARPASTSRMASARLAALSQLSSGSGCAHRVVVLVTACGTYQMFQPGKSR
jgi:hypothetical protein